MREENLTLRTSLARSLLSRIAQSVRAFGPLRVPLAGTLVLLVLPLLALASTSAASGLLRGLFDLNPLSPEGSVIAITLRTTVTCFFAWLAYGLAAVAVCQTASMIIDFSPERLGYRSPRAGEWLDKRLGLRHTVLLCLPALYASYDVTIGTSRHPSAALIGGMIALGAVVLVIVLGIVAFARLDARRLRRLERLLWPILRRIETSGYLSHASASRGPEGPWDEGQPRTATANPLLHHIRALLLFVLSFTVWLLVAFWARSPVIHDDFRVPALCSAMLLVMLLVWILSGLTFFFDYYRVPILSLLLLLAGAVALRDHTFEARPYGGKPNALLPQDVVAPRTLSLDRPLVVIASAGGGIQAAGWTARVLAGIAQAADSDEEYTAFLQQLVVVSGVSGGSVGLAPFVLALDEHATRGTVLRSVDSALTSSLDAVAAAFATFDLLPLSFSDRGSALEENWKRAWKAADLEPAVTLTDLLARTTRGVTPAIMFNATDMTTGERLIIGTTIPRAGQKGVVHAAHLAVEPKTNRVTIDYAPRPQVGDIELAVAARLSATFPFVTPASRCVSCASRDYIVDGGYIDNYGTESLVEWVSPLLAENEARSVLVVQIVSFPESDTAPASGRLALPVPGAPSQLAAPVQAVLNVRAPGQGRRAAYDLDVLQQRFPGRVTWLRFVYEGCRNGSGGVPPLSWHLTAAQKKDLDEWWKGCPHGKGNVWSGYESKARELLDLVLRPSKPSAESVQRQQNTSEIDTSSPKALAAE